VNSFNSGCTLTETMEFMSKEAACYGKLARNKILFGPDSHKEREFREKMGTNEQSGSPLRKGVNMLVIAGSIGKKFLIGDNVTVTILRIKENEIRFSIDAPSDIKVNREEVQQRILNEK
jgi:carbon storage regulator